MNLAAPPLGAGPAHAIFPVMAETRKKRPRDPISLAKLIGDIATRQVEDAPETDSTKDAAAVELGRKGGSAKSDAKTQAARLNGRKGGRPRKAVAA